MGGKGAGSGRNWEKSEYDQKALYEILKELFISKLFLNSKVTI